MAASGLDRGGSGWRVGRGIRLAGLACAGALLLPAGASARSESLRAAAQLPSAPGEVTATGGMESALISWTAASSAGEDAITGYLITASPGGASVLTDAQTSYEVGGLSNGTKYKFTVRGVSSAGTGPASNASKAVRVALPAPPVLTKKSVSVTAGNESASLSWPAAEAPAQAPVTGYVVSAGATGPTVEVSPDTLGTTVTGLTNGKHYKFTVVALNSSGASKAVKASTVTPHETVPGAPQTITAASDQPGQIVVNWEAPGSDGGSAITGYTVTAMPGNHTVSVPGAASSATITGLQASETYAVSVTASNALGAGAPAETTGVPATAAVKEGTVVLSGESLAALSTVAADGELIFENAPAQVTGLSAGEVISAGVSAATPGGLLARVLSVSVNGSETRLATTRAALDEALETGGFAIQSEPGSEQLADFHAARAGVRLERSASPHGLTLGISIPIYKDSSGRTVTVTGSTNFVPNVSFKLSRRFGVIPQVHFEGTLTAKSSLGLSAELSHGFKASYTLGTATFQPIVVDVGIPIVIVPTVEVKLVASGSATAGLSVAASQTTTLGARIDTDGGSVSASPIHHTSTGYTPPTLDGSVSLKAGVQATLKAAVDDIAGPYLRDTLYGLELNVDPAANRWWALDLENQLAAGINVSLLHHTFVDWSTGSLLDEVIHLAHAKGPFGQITVTPARPHIKPGETVQLAGALAGVPASSINWSVPAGQGAVSSSGLYTAPGTPGNYRVSATSPGVGLQPPGFGSADVEVGTQPSEVPSEVIATATGPSSASLTWRPPQSDSPITGYTITTNPGGQQTSAATTSAAVPGLSPGHTYTFTVTAQTGPQSSLPSAPSNPITTAEEGESAENGVWGWGLDADYQLGNKSKNSSLFAIHDLGLAGVQSVAAGATVGSNSRETTGYALVPDGTVRSWGYNYYGEAGTGARSEEPIFTPKPVAGLGDVAAIASMGSSALALKTDGTVWAWGLNDGGIFGDEGKASLSAAPLQVPGPSDVVAIASGERTGYALKSDGTVWAWGYGGFGELGDGALHETAVPPQPVPGLSGIVAIGAGSDFGLAVRSDGTVMAWGGNVRGTLGDGSAASRSLSPVGVSGLTGVTQVAGDAANGYALKSDGTVWAWGLGESGELGNGTNAELSRTPVQVSGIGDAVTIAAGDEAGHALRLNGTVLSWGRGGIYSYLGNGSVYGSNVPVEASNLSGVTAIAATSGNTFAVVRR
jgi:alpha-tubulin suppressor-like RCC1 family protein